MTESRSLWLWLIACNVIWSPVNLLVKTARDAGATPVAIACLRWSTLAVLLAVAIRIPAFAKLTKPVWPSRRDAIWVILIGLVLFGPAHALYYAALSHTTSFEGTILGTTAPIWVAGFAYLILRERLPWTRAVALVTGLIGAYIVTVGLRAPELQRGNAFGNMLYLGAVFMECLAGVLATEVVKRSSGVTVLSLQVAGAAIFLVAAPVFAPGPFPFAANLADFRVSGVLLYLVLFSGMFTFTVWYTLVKRTPLTLMVLTLMLQPPLALALGVVFQNEVVTSQAVLGGIIILASLLLGSREPKTNREAESIAEPESG